MSTYYTLLTEVGKAKLANATALSTTLNLSKIAVGDGDGVAVTPTEDMTALVNQVWDGNISDLRVDTNQSNWIVAETYIASDVGGFTVREVGLFDTSGDLIAIGNYPDSYKPVFESGAAKDMLLRIVIEVSNTDAVELMIDPAIILATREHVEGYAEQKLIYKDKFFADDGYKLNLNEHIRANSVDGGPNLLLPVPLANMVCEINTGNHASTNNFNILGDGEIMTFKDQVFTTLTVNENSLTLRFTYDLENTTWRIS